MNKYKVNHFSNTVGTVFIAVALATQVAPIILDNGVKQKVEKHVVSSTYGQYNHPITGNLVDVQGSIDLILAKAYEDLLLKSVAVDSEIETAIHENLWSLYEG